MPSASITYPSGVSTATWRMFPWSSSSALRKAIISYPVASWMAIASEWQFPMERNQDAALRSP